MGTEIDMGTELETSRSVANFPGTESADAPLRFLAQSVLASFALSLSSEANYFANTYKVTSLPVTLLL
jgi:hypothetical protein